MRTRTGRLAAAVAAAALVLAGCGYEATPVPESPPEPEHTSAGTSDCDTDPATLQSEPADSTPGRTVQRIRSERVLRVGVSADTYLMAARNPRTNRIEGFDIEVIKAIGRAIFGADFNFNVNVQLKVITAGDRIGSLGKPGEEGEVDLVVRNFTINSCRKEEIAFSAVYYEASQKVLLRADQAAAYQGPESLDGQRVCAPAGSTSLDNIEDLKVGAEIDAALTHTGCLIKFQRGEVDAITGDDTVLAGLAAQDPYAVVLPDCDDPGLALGVPCQEPLSNEPYGVGINKADTEFVAFVNFALEQMVDDGAWDRAYSKWLANELGEGSPPEAIR